MFSLLSGESGWAVLWASINCERRSAQAIPAGPPPTITTSAGICGRSIPSIGFRKIRLITLLLRASGQKTTMNPPAFRQDSIGSNELAVAFVRESAVQSIVDWMAKFDRHFQSLACPSI